MPVTFGSDPPPIGYTTQERPGRIEYLYLTPEQKVATKELDAAIDKLPPTDRIRCRNPVIKESRGKQIEYYPHMDFDERTPPTEEEARLMCTTAGIMCPVAEQCLALGLTIQAPVGVWGGRVLIDGEDYYGHGDS